MLLRHMHCGHKVSGSNRKATSVCTQERLKDGDSGYWKGIGQQESTHTLPVRAPRSKVCVNVCMAESLPHFLYVDLVCI